eukprot:1159928-Pelagomonas_calceolata.AAC.17
MQYHSARHPRLNFKHCPGTWRAIGFVLVGLWSAHRAHPLLQCSLDALTSMQIYSNSKFGVEHAFQCGFQEQDHAVSEEDPMHKHSC